MNTKSTALKPLLTSAAMLAMSATASHAAVTLLDTRFHMFNDNDTTGVASRTITAAQMNGGTAINLAGASKLVVTFGGEGGLNAAESTAVTSLSYGGVAMTSAVQQGTGRSASVWYLDLAAVTLSGTDFQINFATSSTDFGLAAYALAGTANGVSSTAQSGGQADNTLTINTPTDNEFVVTTMTRNNYDILEGTSGPGSGIASPLTALFYANNTDSSTAAAYRALGAAGAYDLTIYDTNNSTAAWAAASFQAVPEPTSALAGLLLVGSILRRRRA